MTSTAEKKEDQTADVIGPSDSNQGEEGGNDLIIDQGFPALNTFQSNSSDHSNEDNMLIPKFSFASFPSALEINKEQEENIIHDCNLAFTARTKEDSDAYSSGATFFIPTSMKPRCALEELALKIFQTHTKHLIPGKHYDVERSGAEWWTLVLDTAENGTKNNNDDNEGDNEEDDEDDEVGMHFDADYGLEEQLPNYLLHPRVATVTYLSNCGVPTFIMNKKSPPPTDVEKQSLNGSIDKGWLSCPLLGKHIGFDGRLLHGAIGTFSSSQGLQTSSEVEGERASKRRKLDGDAGETEDDNSIQQRITFMVNIWLNHCPIDAELIDDDICSNMKTYWENDKSGSEGSQLKGDSTYIEPLKWTIVNSEKPSTLVIKKISLDNGEADSLTETIDSVICNRNVAINFRPKEEILQDIANLAHTCDGKSLEVHFPEKALELEVGDVVSESDYESEEN